MQKSSPKTHSSAAAPAPCIEFKHHIEPEPVKHLSTAALGASMNTAKQILTKIHCSEDSLCPKSNVSHRFPAEATG